MEAFPTRHGDGSEAEVVLSDTHLTLREGMRELIRQLVVEEFCSARGLRATELDGY